MLSAMTSAYVIYDDYVVSMFLRRRRPDRRPVQPAEKDKNCQNKKHC
jgi:hypothetical protein